MTKKQFQMLSRPLMQQLRGYVGKLDLLYRLPLDHVLCGLCFEGSSFDKYSFYVNYFAMPLYVPVDYLTLNFGGRVRSERGDRWNINDASVQERLSDAVQAQCLPFFSRIRSASQLADVIEEDLAGRDRYREDPNALEAIAYSRIMAGDDQRSKQALTRLLAALDPSGVPWHSKIKERAGMLWCLDPVNSRQRLIEWEKMTITSLGLKAE